MNNKITVDADKMIFYTIVNVFKTICPQPVVNKFIRPHKARARKSAELGLVRDIIPTN